MLNKSTYLSSLPPSATARHHLDEAPAAALQLTEAGELAGDGAAPAELAPPLQEPVAPDATSSSSSVSHVLLVTHLK